MARSGTWPAGTRISRSWTKDSGVVHFYRNPKDPSLRYTLRGAVEVGVAQLRERKQEYDG